MSEINRAIVALTFADGQTIDAWNGFHLRDTFTDPLGSLDFVTQPVRGRIADYRKRLQKGEPVRVYVGSKLQGTFLVQTVRQRIDANGVTFDIHCESLLAPAYQASVDPDLSLHNQTDVSVLDAVLKALAPFGFNSIVGDSAASRKAISGAPITGGRASPAVDSLKHQDAQAQDGETAYAFCARIFTRLGVALKIDHAKQLYLSAPDYAQSPSYTLVQDFSGVGKGDRFLDGLEIESTNDGQFSECVCRGCSPDVFGQKQSGRPKSTVPATAVGARAQYSSSAAPYKPRILTDKHSRDAERTASVAKLAMGLAAAKAFVVTGEVDGLVSRERRLWTVDTIAQVTIEAADINEPMWILEREWILDGSGQRTRLKLIPKGALVLGDLPS